MVNKWDLVTLLWDKLSMEDIKLVPELLILRLEYKKLVLREKLQQVMPLLLLYLMLLVESAYASLLVERAYAP